MFRCQYQVKEIMNFLLKDPEEIMEYKFLVHQNITNYDLLMTSVYMAGKNSPFPYNNRGNKMSYNYMKNVLYRETGYELKELTESLILKNYGEVGLMSFGRCMKNLTDLMGPLECEVQYKNGTLFIMNKYIKVYDREKVYRRLSSVERNEEGLALKTNNTYKIIR